MVSLVGPASSQVPTQRRCKADGRVRFHLALLPASSGATLGTNSFSRVPSTPIISSSERKQVAASGVTLTCTLVTRCNGRLSAVVLLHPLHSTAWSTVSQLGPVGHIRFGLRNKRV